MANHVPDELWQDYHAMLFGVRRSIRYHSKRQSFFERLDQVLNIILLMSGTGAVAFALQESKGWGTVVGLIVALLSSISLVVNLQRKAFDELGLVKQFIELEEKLTCSNIDQELLRQVRSKRLSIEATEGSPLLVLDRICHNEQARAENHADSVYQISKVQHLLAHFLDWRPGSLEKDRTDRTVAG